MILSPYQSNKQIIQSFLLINDLISQMHFFHFFSDTVHVLFLWYFDGDESWSMLSIRFFIELDMRNLISRSKAFLDKFSEDSLAKREINQEEVLESFIE